MCSQVSNIGPCLIPTNCEMRLLWGRHHDPKEAMLCYAKLVPLLRWSPEEAIVL